MHILLKYIIGAKNKIKIIGGLVNSFEFSLCNIQDLNLIINKKKLLKKDYEIKINN